MGFQTDRLIYDTSLRYTTSAYTVTSNDFNNIIEASGTFTVYFPTNLPVGFQTMVINAGGGTITINASTGAVVRSTDSNNKLSDRYAAASAVKRDATTWYVFGNLKA